MRITHNSPDHLILDRRPWILGAALIVLILTGLGMGMNLLMKGTPEGAFFLFGSTILVFIFYLFVRRIQVVFDRPGRYVEIRRKSLFDSSAERHMIHEVSEATIQTFTSDDGDLLYRIALVIPQGQSQGTHPITEVYYDGWDAHGVANRVNDWLNSATAPSQRDFQN